MPISKQGSGYQWGQHGMVYPTRKQAARQAAAAYANGYRPSGMLSKNKERKAK